MCCASALRKWRTEKNHTETTRRVVEWAWPALWKVRCFNETLSVRSCCCCHLWERSVWIDISLPASLGCADSFQRKKSSSPPQLWWLGNECVPSVLSVSCRVFLVHWRQMCSGIRVLMEEWRHYFNETGVTEWKITAIRQSDTVARRENRRCIRGDESFRWFERRLLLDWVLWLLHTLFVSIYQLSYLFLFTLTQNKVNMLIVFFFFTSQVI